MSERGDEMGQRMPVSLGEPGNPKSSGEHNGPRGHFHYLWKWLVAKRSKAWLQELASAYNHSQHLPHTSRVCMALTNTSLGILLNLPVDHIE